MKKRLIALLLICTVLMFSVPASDVAYADGSRNRNPSIDVSLGGIVDHSYDEIRIEAMMNGVTDFTDPKYGFNDNNYVENFRYLWYGVPEIIGLNGCYRESVYPPGSQYDVTLGYKVNYVDGFFEERRNFDARLPEVIEEIDALLPENPSDFDIVLIVHDYLAATTAYDKDYIDTYNKINYVYDASGPFVHHWAVCQGYAQAFMYIMEHYGIPCGAAHSATAVHAWNVVMIDGEWYHLDITYDDMYYDVLGYMTHDFFLLSTETLLSKAATRSDFKVYLSDYNLIFTDDTCATNKKYETGDYFWKDAVSECYNYNGDWYYMAPVGDSKFVAIYKNGELFYEPQNEHMQWHPYGNIGAIYTNAYGAVSGKDNMLYYMTPKHVCRLNLDTMENEIVCTVPNDGNWGDQIFGLARIEGVLYTTIKNVLPSAFDKQIWIPVIEEEGKCSGRVSNLDWSLTDENKLLFYGNLGTGYHILFATYDKKGKEIYTGCMDELYDPPTVDLSGAKSLKIFVVDNNYKPVGVAMVAVSEQ